MNFCNFCRTYHTSAHCDHPSNPTGSTEQMPMPVGTSTDGRTHSAECWREHKDCAKARHAKPSWCAKGAPCDYDGEAAYCPNRECRQKLEAELTALRDGWQTCHEDLTQALVELRGLRKLTDDLLTAEPETADDYVRLVARLRDRARKLRS